MKSILVVAPHADDETLGCGGTIRRLVEEGADVYWMIITSVEEQFGYSPELVKNRKSEIELVSKKYGFKKVFQLPFQPASLDTLPKGELIGAVSKVINQVKPDTVFTTFRNDVHSDHEMVFDAVVSSTKLFRYPFIEQVIAYETLSETDFALKPGDSQFKPNLFVNIDGYLADKIDIMNVFASEMGDFPFPRSVEAIEALAKLRGVQANCQSAEAFYVLKRVI